MTTAKEIQYKPMLARDWIQSKVKYPCEIQPKIDGVRGINRNGKLLGRSLKPHANPHVTALFSKEEFHGFDGEIILGSDPTAPDLCRKTSGAMRREYGVECYTWYIFDYLTDETKDMTYSDRMHCLFLHFSRLPPELQTDIRIIPRIKCYSAEDLLEYDSKFLDSGFEGSIIRDFTSLYKPGRSDGKMQVWRIKRFIDAEIIVKGITEGFHNANEAKTNELGRTSRSTNQDNMIPNGTLGSIQGILLADVLDVQTGDILLAKGLDVTVSPGKLTEKERKFYFENQEEILGKIVKFKLFPKGTLDKPRFPTFDSIRSPEDMSS